MHIFTTDERKISKSPLAEISLGQLVFLYISLAQSQWKFFVYSGIGFWSVSRKEYIKPLYLSSNLITVKEEWELGHTWNYQLFQGEASAFYGLRYKVDEKITIEYEHTTDQMLLRAPICVSPWN